MKRLNASPSHSAIWTLFHEALLSAWSCVFALIGSTVDTCSCVSRAASPGICPGFLREGCPAGFAAIHLLLFPSTLAGFLDFLGDVFRKDQLYSTLARQAQACLQSFSPNLTHFLHEGGLWHCSAFWRNADSTADTVLRQLRRRFWTNFSTFPTQYLARQRFQGLRQSTQLLVSATLFLRQGYPAVTCSVSAAAEEYESMRIFPGDDFTMCFRIRRSAWSDGGYTLKRQFTVAFGIISHSFHVKVGLACYSHAQFALENLTFCFRLRSTDFGFFWRRRFVFSGMLGSTADTSSCNSARWHLEEFRTFPS